jgi:hypothetical protein
MYAGQLCCCDQVTNDRSRELPKHTLPHHHPPPSAAHTDPPRSVLAAGYPLMVLIQFSAAVQCASKWAVCTVRRGIRTAASQVQFSTPFVDHDEDYGDRTRASPSSSSSVLPKRHWMAYTPKSLPSLQPHSGGATQERSLSLAEYEQPPTPHISKKAMCKPTPVAARTHRERMKSRFPEGWSPPHKLSRQAMDGLRVLHMHDPETFSTPMLAERFRISPEAVRRILRSKWEPSPEQKARLLRRELREKQAWIESKRAAEREEYKALGGGRVGRKRGEDKLTFV